MKKSDRQKKILEIIAQNEIETQDELSDKLIEMGYNVTQATISRDIKELHLIKVQSRSGIYKYSLNEYNHVLNYERMIRVFKETTLSIKSSGNIIVIHTLSGSGNAAAEAIDKIEIEEIIGTVAGDNTIFLCIEEGKVDSVIQRLKSMMY